MNLLMTYLNKKKCKIFITGGTGFIGTNLAIYLAKRSKENLISLYDNFSMSYEKSKRIKILKSYKNIKIIKGDIEDQLRLRKSMRKHHVIFHLASNADISAAEKNPSIDFFQGVCLTKNVLESARINKIKEIYFTSGSGVYGENKNVNFSEAKETYHPVSPYGANKLSSESLISAYCYMFGLKGISFRLANVIGELQTHGVIFDFFKKMKMNKKFLNVLGNGSQKKSYIHVIDVISGMLYAIKKNKKIYDTFNVANNDTVTVKYIANQCVAYYCNAKKLKKHKIKFQKQIRGWNGDVPIIKMSNKKIRSLGWKFSYSSKEAVKKTVKYFCNTYS